MSWEGRAEAEAEAEAEGAGPLRRLLAAPAFLSRWRQRRHQRQALADAPAATPTPTPDAARSFFALDEDDEPRGEVTLYPISIDSNAPSENTTPETPRSAQGPQLPENPLEALGTLAEAEVEASALRLSIDAPKAPTTRPQKRMLLVGPAAPAAAVVVRCVCWVLAQRLVRQFLEKAVGASQRWLFANVCSRRIRLALIGAASILWGVLVGAVSICALFVIISGDLESVVEEAAQLGEWCDTIATTAAASFLALHVAQALFGALLIAASKVRGYRDPNGNVKLMEKLLLALFELMKIDITLPPPAPCNHEPPSPSPSPSDASSPRGSVRSHDEMSKDDRDRSPRPSGSQQEQCRPSYAETPPPLPAHVSPGHIGWVRPGERENGDEGRKWPALPGNWSAPDFSSTVSHPNNSAYEPSNQNLPYPTPSNTNASWTFERNPSRTEPGHPPYPVPTHPPYPGPHVYPDAVARDLPYPGPSFVPYPAPPWSPGAGPSIGFQAPPSALNQTATVEVANYSFKVRILKRQAPCEQEGADEEEEEGEEGPSPVPHLLAPWLYTAWATLAAYALLSAALAAVDRAAAAAAVAALQGQPQHSPLQSWLGPLFLFALKQCL